MSDFPDTGPTPAMIEQAAHWAAVLDSGEMSDENRKAYAEWCAEHPLHRRTLNRMRAFDARMANADDIERDALRSILSRRSYRRLGGALLAIAVLAVTGWVTMQSDFVRDRFPDYQTRRGMVRTVALKDGSEIVLDTDGAVGVDIDAGRRRLRLIRGQVLARVTKDRFRPFVVATPYGTATALGTTFMVREEDGYAQVTVIESRVRVCPRSSEAVDEGCRTLAAGERVRVTRSQILMLQPVDPSSAAMWSNGWLEADDREVSDVLAELSRYSVKRIRFDAASLKGSRVTGSFPLQDVDRAIEGVARAAALDVRRDGESEIIVTRRR